MKKILFFSIITLIVSPVFAQEATESTKKASEKAQKNTAMFKTDYFLETKGKHLAVFFNVEDGRMFLDTTRIEVRTWNLPYNPNSGNFKVEYFDGNNKLIGKYLITDPLMVWTSEAKNNETHRMKKGAISILIPNKRAISKLSVTDVNLKSTNTYSIGSLMMKLKDMEQ